MLRKWTIVLTILIAAGPVAAQQQQQQQADETRQQAETDAGAQEYLDRASRGSDFPQQESAQRFLRRSLSEGQFGPIVNDIGIATTTRYLVTYMNSQTGGTPRSATVVSVTNQSDALCAVRVTHHKGLTPDTAPVCSTAFSIPSRHTVDFCTRDLPNEVTTCNSVCSPELTFDEGRSLVSSVCRDLGVSARVYYTDGDEDRRISAITDSKVVRYDSANIGD